MFGYGVNINEVESYYNKATAIGQMLMVIAEQGLVDDPKNTMRIYETNYNNLNFLIDCLNSGQMPGKVVFWSTKKTIDMNMNTVQSMVNRLQPEL